MIRGSFQQPDSARNHQRERERRKKARWRARMASPETRATIARNEASRALWERLRAGEHVTFLGVPEKARARARRCAEVRGLAVSTCAVPEGCIVWIRADPRRL